MLSCAGRLWRADHAGTTPDWKDELGRWVEPFLDRLGHKARRHMCPPYVAGLIVASICGLFCGYLREPSAKTTKIKVFTGDLADAAPSNL